MNPHVLCLLAIVAAGGFALAILMGLGFMAIRELGGVPDLTFRRRWR